MPRLASLALALGLGLLAAAPAAAGPIADFEAEFRSAYADYRNALFQTNRNDKAATLAALGAFRARWDALKARWADRAPPHFSEDGRWPLTLDAIGSVAVAAAGQAEAGDLAKAHETLEGIREQVSDLHRRNGVVRFSDRMNAYHEMMEHTLAHADPKGPEGRRAVGEYAAVLAWLAEALAKGASEADRANPEYQALAAALRASVEALRGAVADDDAAAIRRALDGLKPAYSKFFLKFG